MDTEVYRVEKNSEYGRYLVATRDLQAGEYLFEDVPFVVGPKARSKCCCLECYTFIDATANGTRCEICSWPICSDCMKLGEHKTHKRECKIFSAAKCKFFNLDDPKATCIQLDCVTPLRVILEKEENPQRFEEEVEPMQDHKEERFETDAWNADQQNIVGYLLGPCKLKAMGITEELIQQVIGILEVNTFEAKTSKGDAVRCLYTKLAISSHSCSPNTTHAIHSSDNFRMHIRATTFISKDSQLYSCYTYTLNPTMDRQQHLMEGKYFKCRCERCLDPLELGTNFSSVKCSECAYGDVNSLDPLDQNASCKCNKCAHECSSSDVKEMTKALQNEIESMENSVDFLEQALDEIEPLLHPNHFIMIYLKNALIDSYGHVKGFQLSEMPEVLLKKKIDLCEELLKILDIFEKGKSRARALMMFELHAPLVLYAKKQLDLGNFSKSEYLEQLLVARKILSEAKEIIDWEDENVCSIKSFAKESMNHLNLLIEEGTKIDA